MRVGVALVLTATALAGLPSAAVASAATKPLTGDPRVCWWSHDATRCIRDNVPIALQKHGVQGDMDCTASRQFLYRCTVKGTRTAGAYTVEFVKGAKRWTVRVTPR